MKTLAVLLLAFSACTSVGSYTQTFPDGSKVNIEAGSYAVGSLHQFLQVSTERVDPAGKAAQIETTTLPDVSAGQVAVSTLTTGAMVGGAAFAVYSGLKNSGGGLSIP